MTQNRFSQATAESNGHASLLTESLPGATPAAGRPEGGAVRPEASPPPLMGQGSPTGQGSPNPPPDAAAAEGRDEKGRFAAGNKGGPGNPFARRVAALRQVILEELGPEDVRQLIRKLKSMASEGHVQAHKLLLSYGLGRPTKMANPDRLDQEEWAGYHETANWMQDVPGLITRPSREFPLDIVRTAQPAMVKEMAGTLGGILSAKGKDAEQMQAYLTHPNPSEGMRLVREKIARQQTDFRKKKDKKRR
jgi:hypothetical protein